MKAGPLVLVLTLTCGGTAVGYWLGHARAASLVADTERRIEEATALAVAQTKAEAARDFAKIGRIPMPAGMSADGLNSIMSAPGPLDRFQGIFSHIQGLPADQIESEILSVREQMQAGNFDPERMFAMHLLMTRFGLANPNVLSLGSMVRT